jgi:hypothetical protein
VAEQRAFAAGEDRGHRSRQRRLDGADEVDPAVHPPQPALRHPMRDRMPTESQLGELTDGDDRVLAARDDPDPAIDRHNVTLAGAHEVACHELPPPAAQRDTRPRRLRGLSPTAAVSGTT